MRVRKLVAGAVLASVLSMTVAAQAATVAAAPAPVIASADAKGDQVLGATTILIALLGIGTATVATVAIVNASKSP